MMNLLRLLKKLTPTSLLVHHLDRELDLHAEENAKLARELGAELAENQRLVEELTAARRLLATAVANSQGRPLIGSMA